MNCSCRSTSRKMAAKRVESPEQRASPEPTLRGLTTKVALRRLHEEIEKRVQLEHERQYGAER